MDRMTLLQHRKRMPAEPGSKRARPAPSRSEDGGVAGQAEVSLDLRTLMGQSPTPTASDCATECLTQALVNLGL